MQAHIELAILDHNYNTQRKQATTLYCACLLNLYISGKARYSVTFLKGRKAWIAKPILEDKDYKHLTHMMEDIIQFRLNDKRDDMIDYDTPSTIPHNIATIEWPPK